MTKQDLDIAVDQQLLEEFDNIVLEDFCAPSEIAIKSLEITSKYNVGYEPKDVWRRIKVEVEQSISFAKVITQGNTYPPVGITITGSYTHLKGQKWFSFTDFCAIFYPEDRFEVTSDWQKTLKSNLRALKEDLSNLYARDIVVSIASEKDKDRGQEFWEKPESSFKSQFYTSALPVMKLIIEKEVLEISLLARWGSDSPYQRFKDSEKWALISFRPSKRQQVDIVQYVEFKKIRFKCALLDLGFLENGYGKVAKIKEVISMDMDLSNDAAKLKQAQSDFLSRVLKELPNIIQR